MWRTTLILALGLVTFAPRPQAADTPSLLVILVVDQLRADYLRRFERHWQHGFRTLLADGRVFENARYPYLNTVTCAGHATVGTGAYPRTHGWVLNTWWHRDERRNFDCTDDPGAPDITYGRPVRLGNSARRMAVPTLADELRAQRPGARVVSVSLKARSAIGMAGHGGDAVVWFDDAAGSFASSHAFAAGPVTVLEDWIEKNPYERDLGRAWNLKGPATSYLQRDAGIGERPPAPWSGLFPHVVAGRTGTLDAQFFDIWQTSPLADDYLGRMAAGLVDGFSLGQRGVTDFLGISFSALDEVGHDFGPDSREVEDVLRHFDATLGSLIEKLDSRVGRANYVVALTADHGVAPVPQPEVRGGKIISDDLRERIEEVLTTEFGPLQKGSYVDAVNFVYAYLAPGVFDRLRASPAAMAAIERAVKDVPGVAQVLRADQLSATSSDAAVRAAALSHFPGRSGDLIVVPKPYWSINLRSSTTATTHGTLHDYDTHVPIVLFGGPIARGRVAAAVTPADIAPTLAFLADVKLTTPDGRVLPEIGR